MLHCPCDVGGQAGTLAKNERALGLHSWSVALTAAGLGMPIDEVLAGSGSDRMALEIGRWKLLYRAATKFDVIHFNFGRTISPLDHRFEDRYMSRSMLKRLAVHAYANATWFKDAAFLKRLGKVLVMTYQGDDARQGDYCRLNYAYSPAMEVDSGYYTAASDESKRRAISTMSRLADRMYALNPDLLSVLPESAKFLPYANLDFREWQFLGPKNGEIPIVVHAPTSREFKGTKYILAAVDELKQEGLKFEFKLVENMTRDVARSFYEQADILIDQVLAGWYGGLAVELMALGKPVICYIRNSDLSGLPDMMRSELPIINANPDNLTEMLRKLINMTHEERYAIGVSSRKFVEKWHDPLKIAESLSRDYRELYSNRSCIRC